ncbi:14879_t:CDS:2, partial [Dentiscutata erythropus]
TKPGIQIIVHSSAILLEKEKAYNPRKKKKHNSKELSFTSKYFEKKINNEDTDIIQNLTNYEQQQVSDEEQNISNENNSRTKVEPLFANKLKDVIKAKNKETKFFNDATWQNKRAQFSQTSFKNLRTGLIEEETSNAIHQTYSRTICLVGNKIRIFTRTIPNN